VDDTFDVTLRTAVYRHFATTGQSPTLDAMREAIGATSDQVRDGYRRLYAKRLLVPAHDFASIRMAPPFSGVRTQHRATVNGTEYFANCHADGRQRRRITLLDKVVPYSGVRVKSPYSASRCDTAR
jgi:hypothetical protein